VAGGVVAVADRVLKVAGVVLAVLMPFVVGLAGALLVRGPGPAVGSVIVLCTCWLVGLGVIAGFAFRPVRVPTKRGLR
jgi:hypothetical protein